jgi:hypothetical protein
VETPSYRNSVAEIRVEHVVDLEFDEGASMLYLGRKVPVPAEPPFEESRNRAPHAFSDLSGSWAPSPKCEEVPADL